MVEEEKIEEELPKKKKLPVWKAGVMAKCAAMDKAANDVESGAKQIIAGVKPIQQDIKKMASDMEDAAKKMEAGVAELQSAIQAQAKENEKAASDMASGVRKLQGDMKKMQGNFKSYGQGEFKNSIRDFYFG